MPSPADFAAGAVYFVNDADVSLPGEERITHDERRPVVVVSDQGGVHGTNAQHPSDWPSVLVVPISSKTSRKTRFCVLVASGDGNLKKKGWARVPALQMVDKECLQDMLGFVRPETLDKITAQILNYLGILSVSEEIEEDEAPF